MSKPDSETARRALGIAAALAAADPGERPRHGAWELLGRPCSGGRWRG